MTTPAMPDPLDPDTLDLLAAAGRVRVALAAVADAVMPGRRRPVPSAPSEAARARRDAERRAERADAYLTGYGLGVDQPAPLRLAPLAAQLAAADLVTAAARRAAAHLGRRHAAAPADEHDQAAALAHVCAATDPAASLDWLDHLAHTGRLTGRPAADVAALLDQADELARTGAGLTVERRPLHAACPACGRRSLYVDTSSSDRTGWRIGCDRNACRCLGDDCPCGRWSTWRGRRHVWPYAEWADLARRLAAPARWRRAPAVPCPCACHRDADTCDVLGGCVTIGCHDAALGGAA